MIEELPKCESGYIDEYEKVIFKNEIEKTYFETNYSFSRAHNGYRNGELHIFMGREGSGKSTVVRSILLDIVSRNEYKICILLSEESIRDFRKMLSFTNIKTEFLKNVDIYSEQDFDFKNPRRLIESMGLLIKENKYDMFIFDNITTSICYTYENGKHQEWSASQFKKMASKIGIPVIIISHADSDSSRNVKKLMTSTDIRGNKSLPLQAQFFYIVDQVTVDDKKINFIRIKKHRSMPNVENYIFQLFYNPEFGIYTSDIAVNFEKFKEILNNGDSL